MQGREIDRLSQSAVQSAMPYVSDNADDFVRLPAQRTCEEAFAERVFAGKVKPREFVTDQDDFRIVAHIRLGEAAALSQRDAHGSEVVVIDVAYISVRVLPGSRFRSSLDFELKVGGLSGQGKLRDQSDSLDARQGGYALLQLIEKLPLLLRLAIWIRHIDSRRQQIFLVEAAADLLQTDETVDEQTRANQQRHRERHFTDDQKVQRAMGSRSTACAFAAFLERLRQIQAGRLQRRRKPEKQPREDRK